MVVVGGGGGDIVYSLISPPRQFYFPQVYAFSMIMWELIARTDPYQYIPVVSCVFLSFFLGKTKMFNHFILDLSPFGHFKRSAPVLIKT